MNGPCNYVVTNPECTTIVSAKDRVFVFAQKEPMLEAVNEED